MVAMEECVFCSIASHHGKGGDVLYKDDKCVVVPDLYPSDYGHVLVISKVHYANMLEAPDEIICHMFEVAKLFAKAQEKSLGAAAVNISTNIGALAGQLIMHFHVHVIPRYANGKRPSGFKKHSEITDEYRAELKRLLSDAVRDAS